MNLTYSEALRELQHLIAELQDEQVDVEELNRRVERAAELIRYCRERLREAGERLDGLLGEE